MFPLSLLRIRTRSMEFKNTSMVSLTILVSLHIICLCNLGNTDTFAQYPLLSCTLFRRCRSWPHASGDIAWARSSQCHTSPCMWTAWSGDVNGSRSHTRRPFLLPCCMKGLRTQKGKWQNYIWFKSHNFNYYNYDHDNMSANIAVRRNSLNDHIISCS